MTVLEINGRRVTVDDSFKSLSPEQQQATVNEIASSLGMAGAQSLEQQEQDEARKNLAALGTPTPPKDPNDKSYTGSILPVSYDREGKMSFDSNAGILGAVKSAVTAPGRAMSGELQVAGPDGRTTPEAIAEAINFAGFASPMTPELRSGGFIVPGEKRAVRPAKVEPPPSEALKAASKEGYDALRTMDARYSAASISDMAADLERKLAQQGINEKVAPKTVASLKELQRPPKGGFASSSDIETVRRTFGKIGEDYTNLTDRYAGKFVRGAVDDFLGSPPAGSVLPGSEGAASKVGELARTARGNYAASKRSDKLNSIVTAAEDRAGASNSGQNVGNTLRQRAASVLASAKQSSGFTENELAAIRAVARGTKAQNVTRYVGNLLGGGGGLGAGFTAAATGTGIAAATGNPLMAGAGVVAPLVGAGSKQLSNIMSERAWAAVDKATRMRSPLYQQMLKDAPLEPITPVAGPTALRSILLTATNPRKE